MTTSGPERTSASGDPARISHDPLFEDPAESPPVLDPSWQQPAPPVAPPPPAPAPPAGPGATEDDVPPTSSPVPSVHTDESPSVAEPPSVDLPRREPPARAVDTGRLFRSAGAEGPAATGAIPALPDAPPRSEPDAGTPGHSEVPAGAVAGIAVAGAMTADGAPAGGVSAAGARIDGAPAVADAGPAQIVIPGGAGATPPDGSATGAERVGTTATRSGRGLAAPGIWAVILGVTVLVGFAEALLRGELGWITGVALVLSTLYAALTARPDDLWLAVIVPPLAFFVTTLTAGQVGLPGGQGLLVREGVMIFTTLSVNAPWIVGATGLALVIVLIRRRRARAAGVL